MGKDNTSWVYKAYLALEVPAYCTAYRRSRYEPYDADGSLEEAISKTAWGISNSTM
jgi:hypothetical protein